MADTAMLLWGNFCTALAYFILTVQMVWFIRNPKFTRLFFTGTRGKRSAGANLYLLIILFIALFASFFIMCGLTHFMGIIHFYYPDNFNVLYFQSSIMVICAFASILAAIVGFWVFPIVLNALDKFEFSSEGTIQHHDNYLLEAIEMIQESIVILTPDLKIVRGNQASKLIFGEKSINTDIIDYIYPLDTIMFLDNLNRVMTSYSLLPITIEVRVRKELSSNRSTGGIDIISGGSAANTRNNTSRIRPTRVYCDNPNAEESFMWIECTLCKGARVSVEGNFDYDLKMISRNISGRKKQVQDQNLQQSTEEKARINETKLKYMACIAHDLKTPLQSFGSTIEKLNQTKVSTEQLDLLQHATVAVDLMKLTISQTMDLSKALAGVKLIPRRTAVNLSNIVEHVKVIINNYGKQVPVSFEVAKDVCDTIITDEEWLWQMMLNLLTNACKYTDKGCIQTNIFIQTVDTSTSAKDKAVEGQKTISTDVTNLLVCEVIDTGVGVRDDKLATLFDAFAQVQDVQVTGTGLGLFGVRTRAEGLGGSCGARPNSQSSTGTGTVIWFTIPYVPDRAELSSAPRSSDNNDNSGTHSGVLASPEDLQHRTEQIIRARQLTAMVVDDGKTMCKMRKRVLLGMGFARVECYEDGSQGLEAMMAQQVDIVFSDVEMPMTGLEMIRRFRKYESEQLSSGARSSRQVVVAVTGNELQSEECIQADFDDARLNPLRIVDIQQVVLKYCA